ncbi:ABC transporter permease [Actinosynnema pretiosum subsp. pretiosum]|uniref:ABC-2 type transporter n=2 Tax=Actinosynnema TaxID=40566 RepID=C6WFF2_ACTMD|nr:ABC transporter permease [Actinosynnema mirum]ACU35887.1 ABC-2 type transporter [Actinosynnema mirum DSM 43827]QUF06434.1 ABC transporter permease [Actinosynnema pretiosum subsp. pretiosum]
MNTRFLVLELLRATRTRRYLVATMPLPSLMLLVLPDIYNVEGGTLGGVPIAISLMLNMAMFGVISAPVTTGASIAVERGAGWQRQLRLTPLTGAGYVVGKGVVGMLLALPPLLLLGLVGAFTQDVRLTAGQWLVSLGAVWLTGLPFVLLGIVLGLVVSPGAMQAVTGVASLVLGVAGGVLIPVELAPDWLRRIVLTLPMHWGKQLALSPLVDVEVGRALFVLGVWVVGLGLIAARRFRAAEA